MFRLRTTAVSGSLVVVCVAPFTWTLRSDITYTAAKLLHRTTIKRLGFFCLFWKVHVRWLVCKTLNTNLYSEVLYTLNVSFLSSYEHKIIFYTYLYINNFIYVYIIISVIYLYITECLNVYAIFKRKSLNHSATTGKISSSILKQEPGQKRTQIIMAHLTTKFWFLIPSVLKQSLLNRLQTKFTGDCFNIARMIRLALLSSE